MKSLFLNAGLASAAACLVSLVGSSAAPAPAPPAPSPRPVVLWHGMGDSGSSDGMQNVAQIISDVAGPRYVASIALGDDDQRASFFGNVDEQVDAVCQMLAEDEDLKDGFDAIGFSQGGQFLRAYVERCNSPPVKKLITFGAQHMGVSALPGCAGEDQSAWCSIARAIADRAVYSEFVQSRIVQAQYFRDMNRLEEYLEAVKFLTSINNEVEDARDDSYKANLTSLEKLVLILFTEDTTVNPKESAWFGYYADADDQASGNVTEMRNLPIYKEDWIGLKSLDKAKKIDFLECEGGHMQITEEYLQDLVKKYIGDASKGGKQEAAGKREKAKLVQKLLPVKFDERKKILRVQDA